MKSLHSCLLSDNESSHTTECLIQQFQVNTFYFFLFQGGNDYEIFADPKTIGHSTDGPETTRNLVNEALAKL